MEEEKKRAKKRSRKPRAKLSKSNYRIFYVVEARGKLPEKVELARIQATSQEDAVSRLAKWTRQKPAAAARASGKKLYVEKVKTITVMREDGTSFERELGANWTFEREKLPFFKRLWAKATATVDYWLLDKPRGAIERCRDVFYFLKHGQKRTAYWSLDIETIDMLEHQTKRLLANQHGVPQQFIDKALEKLHGKPGEKFDPLEWCVSTNWELTDEEMELGEKLQREAYQKLLDAIALYHFFYSSGDYDPEDPRAEAFYYAHRSMLPRVRGTYDEYDQKKLAALANKQWKRIWQLFTEFGQTMYD